MTQIFNHTAAKLENPVRLAELQPEKTLRRIGIKADDIVCDIGAGSGIFTIPAARLTRNRVLALDISEDMLATIEDKARIEGLANIETVKVIDETFAVADRSVDLALIVTVFHEIPHQEKFVSEVARMIKTDGSVCVIEFHKEETPYGPPVDHRIARVSVQESFSRGGFAIAEDFDLGPNFYVQVYRLSTLH